MNRRGVALLVAAALTISACSRDEGPVAETAEVRSGTVVQTVAAPARIEPRARQTVVAQVSGEVVSVLVEDGDAVAAGDVVLRLASDSVDAAIEQAEAAVDAAGALAGASLGIDLSPLVRALRVQYDEAIPDLVLTLREQAFFIDDDQLRATTIDALDDLDRNVATTRDALLAAERQARGAAAAATASQRAAAEAQQAQAMLALEAAEERADALVVTAPRDGVVELGRATASADLAGGFGLGDGGDLGALLGGGGGSGVDDGPIADGASVTAGQVLFTIYDLSGFHARATVDEVDVIDVAEGQAAIVLVDAFPEFEFDAFVDTVAISPTRGETGGVVYGVTLLLRDVPEEVSLRVGLTASAEVVVREVESDAVIPSSALFRRDGVEVVLVVRDGIVDVTPVRVVALGEDTAAVDGEVRAGDEVVTRGAENLDDGDAL